MSIAGINWHDVNALTTAGINWQDVEALSTGGINWFDFSALSRVGINWIDIGILSDAGINWIDVGALSDAGINWSDLQRMTTIRVNWADLASLSTVGVNWQDLAYMTGTGINWVDMSTTSRAGVNWSDLASMTSANINWSDIAYLASKAEELVVNVDTIVDLCNTINTAVSRIGLATDSATTASLFGRIKQLYETIGSGTDLAENVQKILSTVTTISTDIGSTSDDPAAGTVYGDLNALTNYIQTLKTLVGASGDTSDETVFGELSKLADIEDTVDSAKSAAEAALGEIQGLRTEVGAKGVTPTVYEKLKRLDGAMEELKIASATISESQLETGNVASEMLSKLSKFLNESAKSLGMEGDISSVAQLQADEAKDIKKVHEKLVEINTKLEALRESVGKQDVVVKSWFESGE